MNAPTMDDLREWVSEALQACIDRGMQLPFVLCSASPNGSVLCMRVCGSGAAPDMLAEHYEPEGFMVPITIMILDQAGEAVRVSITADRSMVVH